MTPMPHLTATPDVAAAYAAFLATKHPRDAASGRSVTDAAISPLLYPFQRALVQWCVHRGRAALWASTGLGKTRMALE